MDSEIPSSAPSRLAGALRERLAVVNHELRTPLNGILGYAQLLARDPTLDARHLDAVLNIRRCGERLLTLIDELVGAQATSEGSPAATSRREAAHGPPKPSDAGSTREAPEPEMAPDLRARLLDHARSGDIAALNRCLDELERCATHPRLLAELRAYAGAFDVRAVRARLSHDVSD